MHQKAVALPEAYENVDHEHEVNDQIDDDERVSTTLLTFEEPRRSMLIQDGSFLVFVQQERHSERSEYGRIDDQQQNDPVEEKTDLLQVWHLYLPKRVLYQSQTALKGE